MDSNPPAIPTSDDWTPYDWANRAYHSAERLRRLVELNCPDVIVANEIGLLRKYANGVEAMLSHKEGSQHE